MPPRVDGAPSSTQVFSLLIRKSYHDQLLSSSASLLSGRLPRGSFFKMRLDLVMFIYMFVYTNLGAVSIGAWGFDRKGANLY